MTDLENRPIAPTRARIATRRILVTVGTDHHRFDRLVEWFDQQQIADNIDGLVQCGTSRPGRVDSVDYLRFDQLNQAIEAAEIVVTHGGPGSTMGCRRWGKLPIVCPRDPALGEHIDNHQQLFSERLAAQDQILLATTKAELFGHLDDMAEQPLGAPVYDPGHIERTVERVAAIVDRLVGRAKSSEDAR